MQKKINKLEAIYMLVTCLVLVGLLLYFHDPRLLKKIEFFAARRLLLAWFLMLSLYVFRVFIPLLPSFAFYAMSGRIFPGRFVPFLVSLSGIFLLHILSYTVGLIGHRFRKKRRVPKRFPMLLYLKYQEIRDALYDKTERTIRNGSFRNLILFTLSPFPKKSFGRICGRTKVNFPVFLVSSVIGSLPSIISATLLGKSLSDPSSPAFYASLLLTVTVTVFSVILFIRSNSIEDQKDEKVTER